jgi:hypothetical protein
MVRLPNAIVGPVYAAGVVAALSLKHCIKNQPIIRESNQSTRLAFCCPHKIAKNQPVAMIFCFSV